jgi:flagellar biosynthesis/type III secretory pathway M-ring protein FliF/YscJ
MSQETLNTILSGIAALTGLVAVGIAIHQILQHRKEREEDRRTAEEQRQRAEEQRALARQQSEMRPDLEVSVALKSYGRTAWSSESSRSRFTTPAKSPPTTCTAGSTSRQAS